MDLRAIINSDGGGGGGSKTSRAVPPSQASPPPRGHHPHDHGPHSGHIAASPYKSEGYHHGRPAPPPLQPVSSTDFRSPTGSSSYHSAQSPLPYTPSSATAGGQHQYPFPQHTPAQSPSQSQYPQPHPYREGYPSGPSSGGGSMSQNPHTQPGQPPHTPSATTPGGGGSYHYGPPQHPRSIHSSPTPSSAQSQAQHSYHDSPQSSTSHSYTHLPYHPSQVSQPGTPLGPPVSHSQATAAAYHRDAREPPSPYGHSRTQSAGAALGPPHIQATSPTPPVSGGTARQGQPNGHHRSYTNGDHALQVRGYVPDLERDRSLSVSPKTKVPTHHRANTLPHDGLPAREYLQQTGARLESESMARHAPREDAPPPAPPVSFAHKSALRPPQERPVEDSGTFERDGPRPEQQRRPDTVSPTLVSAKMAQPVRKNQSRPSSRDQPPAPHGRHQPEQQTSAPRKSSFEHVVKPVATTSSSSSPAPPTTRDDVTSKGSSSARSTPAPAGQAPMKTRKRPRDEPPIFAQSVKKNKNNFSMMRKPANAPGGLTGANLIKVEPRDGRSAVSVESEVNGTHNGTAAAAAASDRTATPTSQPATVEDGPLGAWEPSFTNVIPSDEITRVIMDFLFVQVVQRKDVGAGTAGGVPGQGAQLEIEAKLGQLMDKNTNDRIRVPTLTECIFNKEDPSFRTVFKSSMTETQHRALNQFLNKAIAASRAPSVRPSPEDGRPPKARIPMEYVHTRERDRFYELPQAALATLPLSIRPHINGRHKIKVRVTTDQKTGQVLAKIVKVRIADLDVYSPRTAFDWRLSINLEMSYEGEVDGLTEVSEDGKKPDRNKDRLSYRHLAYQIDLTQVTMHSEGNSKGEKEHELEIELSAETVRKQGLLVQAGQPAQYEDVVKGFVDNVRILARALPVH